MQENNFTERQKITLIGLFIGIIVGILVRFFY